MSHRQNASARLYEELRWLEIFDKIHDYGSAPVPASDYAYTVRQTRRAQIVSEIKRLEKSRPDQRNLSWVRSGVIFACNWMHRARLHAQFTFFSRSKGADGFDGESDFSDTH